jgi:hypothetical protein
MEFITTAEFYKRFYPQYNHNGFPVPCWRCNVETNTLDCCVGFILTNNGISESRFFCDSCALGDD